MEHRSFSWIATDRGFQPGVDPGHELEIAVALWAERSPIRKPFFSGHTKGLRRLREAVRADDPIDPVAPLRRPREALWNQEQQDPVH